jgi:hypothetical protein
MMGKLSTGRARDFDLRRFARPEREKFPGVEMESAPEFAFLSPGVTIGTYDMVMSF